MASSLPIIRQVAWLSVVPQVVLMLGLVSVAQLSAIDEPFLVGTAAYLLLLFTLRSVIAKHHRAGVKAPTAIRMLDGGSTTETAL